MGLLAKTGTALLEQPESIEGHLSSPTLDFGDLALRVAEGGGSQFERLVASRREELRDLADLMEPRTKAALEQVSGAEIALKADLTNLVASDLSIKAPRVAKKLSSPEGLDALSDAIFALAEKDITSDGLIAAIKQRPNCVSDILEVGGRVAEELLSGAAEATGSSRGLEDLREEVSHALQIAKTTKSSPAATPARPLRDPVSVIELQAIRDAAEETASNGIYEQDLINEARQALRALRGNPAFKFSPQEVSKFLGGDKESLSYLIRLGELEQRKIPGTAESFREALRTVSEKGTTETGRLGGALIGHARELQVAMKLIEDGYTIEGLSQPVSVGSFSRVIDMVVSKNGKRFLVEVKNSEEALLKGAQKTEGTLQMAAQLYLAHRRGDTLLIVVAEGKEAKQVNEIAAYVQRSLDKAQELLSKSLPSAKGQEIEPPKFLYTNQYVRMQ